MDGHNVPLSLLASIAVLGGLAVCGWGMVGLVLKVAPAAAGRFAASNALLALGAIVTANRVMMDSTASAVIGSVSALSGLTLARAGIQHLLRLPRTRRENWTVLLVCGLIVIVGRNSPRFLDLARLSLALGMGWICLRSVIESAPTLQRDYGRLAATLMSLPFASVFAMLLARAVQWFVAGGAASADSSLLATQSVPVLWGFVALMVIGNSTIAGMTLGRLILRIRELAARDMLTGALTRAETVRRLAREVARALRAKQPLAVAMCDLDHFKAINDTYGHAAGDAVLRHAVATIQATLRQPDLLGRFGGEEFVAILPMTDRTGAIDAAERVRRALADAPVRWHGNLIPVTVSVGVAVVGDSPDEALRRADDALYRAKRGGRNRVDVDPEATPP